MKKRLSIFWALIMLFTCIMGTSTFAAEPVAIEAETTSTENEIAPCGTLSGYGHYDWTAGSARSGSFTVNVTGSAWLTAQTTFTIEGFDENTAVAVALYKPDGSLAYGTLDNSGSWITLANKDEWHNIPFSSG